MGKGPNQIATVENRGSTHRSVSEPQFSSTLPANPLPAAALLPHTLATAPTYLVTSRLPPSPCPRCRPLLPPRCEGGGRERKGDSEYLKGKTGNRNRASLRFCIVPYHG